MQLYIDTLNNPGNIESMWKFEKCTGVPNEVLYPVVLSNEPKRSDCDRGHFQTSVIHFSRDPPSRSSRHERRAVGH